MEKAALVAGGVALIAYCAFGENNKGDHNNANVPQLLHPGLTRLQPPPRHVLPPPEHSTEPALKHLVAPQRRLLPAPPLDLHPGLAHLEPPGRHLLPPPVDNTTPGLQKLHAANRRLLPQAPHETEPGLLHLRRANLHLLPQQPADPIGLVPLAPKELQPRAPLKLQPPRKVVGKPIEVAHGETPCMRLAEQRGQTMGAWYNYPGPKTIDECYNLLVTIPCPASKCPMYWQGKMIQ